MRWRIPATAIAAILCAACGSSNASPLPSAKPPSTTSAATSLATPSQAPTALPSIAAATPAKPPATATPSKAPAVQPAAANGLLAAPKQQIPPPPIVSVPRSTVAVEGHLYDAYRAPGNRLRLLCAQPCSLDQRLIEADYAGSMVSVQQLVRNVGFDVVDSIDTIDVHLTRDDRCQRTEGEIGLSGQYTSNPKAAFICTYLSEADLAASDPENPMTPETAIRMGGLGVFAHEYTHVLLFVRFTFSSHDFVFPIEKMTLDPDNPASADLCGNAYGSGAPLTVELCKRFGFTYAQMVTSLRMVDRLYQDGYGNVRHAVGVNQYRAILNKVLGKDTTPAFETVGYMKIINDEAPSTPYKLPWTGCTYDAAYTADKTVPIGAVVDFNAAFDKTWTVANTGTCDWDGVKLVFVGGGDQASAPVALAQVPAGSTLDVTARLRAPATPGVHLGQYRLLAPAGKRFGPIFSVVVYARPGCSASPLFTDYAASPAKIGRGGLSLLTWTQVTNVDSLELLGLGKLDPSGGRLLVQPERTTTYTLRATCGSRSVAKKVTVTVDPSLPAFAITKVTASADPPTYTGSCATPKRIAFTGEFVSNGPGVVLYRWDRMDSSGGRPQLWTFDSAGAQRLMSEWQVGASLQGWMELKIVAPVESEPVRAAFSLTCS